jgi:hypothetical protein
MAAQVYIRSASGRQRLISGDELDAYKAQGWRAERFVEVEEKPAPKKKASAKKKAK